MASMTISRFRGSPFAFPLAALTALAMFFISETSYQQATGALDGLRDMSNARVANLELRRAMTDAETGQRGYLLTHRREYLEPYNRGLSDAGSALGKLNVYYANRPDSQTVLKRINDTVAEKLSELRITLNLYDEGKEEAWRDLLLSNIGKEKMDSLRALSDELLALENSRVEVERRGVYQTLLINRIGVTAMTALSLLALFMYLRQTAALESQREERQPQNGEEAGHLSRRC
jgi:CHASE3 domain sensor protein